MPMTAAERKQKQRANEARLGIKPYAMDLTLVEREIVSQAALAAGYEDQTEYLLALVYADRDKSRKEQSQ